MNLVFPPLYAIIDPTLLTTSELALAETLAESGVELLQYRNKRASTPAIFRSVESSFRSVYRTLRRPICAPRAFHRERPARISRCWSDAGGVHVGQDDLRRGRGARNRGPRAAGWAFPRTRSSKLDAADRTSADYIAFGPIFPTATKENPDPVVGLRLLAAGARAHDASRWWPSAESRSNAPRKFIAPAPIRWP